MEFPEIILSKIPASLREFLENRRYTCIGARYDEASFGNIVLDCTDQELIIRVVKDRRQVFVDVASVHLPDEWHMLPDLLAFLNRPGIQIEYIEQDHLAAELGAHYEKIRELLAPENTRRADLKIFEEKRREATFAAMLTPTKPPLD